MKRSERKLNLSRSQKFWHYSVLYFLAVMPVISLYTLYQYFVTGDYTGPRKPINFYIIGGIGIALILIFYIIQTRRLRFLEVHKSVSRDKLELAVNQCAFELDWKIVKKSDNRIVAKRKNWGFYGERITVIHESDKILINSICDPDKLISMVSYGQNRENIKCLLKRISEIQDS